MKPLAQERAAATDTKSIRGERIDAVVICSDDQLLIELGPVLGDRYRTQTVDSPADIGGQVTARRWIGIVDVDCLDDARDAVRRLELQYHRCPLILVASKPEEWAGAVSRGAVLAAIARDQVATVRLSEALVVAEGQLQAGSDADDQSLRQAQDAAVSTSSRPARQRNTLAAIGLVAALAALGIWLHYRHAPSAPYSPGKSAAAEDRTAPAAEPSGAAPSEAPSAVGPAAADTDAGAQPSGATPRQQSVLELLSAARVVFREQKLLLPRADGELRGDSALELYAQVLSQDPQNDEALDGVRRLFVIGRERINADLATGKLDDANHLLGLFRTAGVADSDLQTLTATISAARPKLLAQRAAQNIAAGDLNTADQLLQQLVASGADPASIATLRQQMADKKLELQLTDMAAQVRSAIQAGALLQPANDSARTRLTAMRTVARAHPVTLAAQHELQAALLQAAEQATRATDFDLAQRDLSAAADLGNFAPIAEAKRQLQAAMASAQHASDAAAAARQAEQSQAAERARAAAPSTVAPAVSHTAPTYIAGRPTRALRLEYPAGTDATGYVVVEFTLSADGSASDPTVVESSPPGVFDQAAITAVRSGRYDTQRLVDRQPVRARILLRFKSQ